MWPQLNTSQEQLRWQGYYFPFLFLSSQRHDGSEETRGGREIKEEELERKRAGKKTKQGEMGRDREDREKDRAKQGGSWEEKEGRETACCVLKGND